MQPSQRILKSYLGIALLLCLLACCYSNVAEQSYLVLKGDKVFALGMVLPRASVRQDEMSKMWVSNNQDAVKIQVPVRVHTQQQHQTVNHTQVLPIFYSLLTSKGYLKPYRPFTNEVLPLVKGFKYTKPSYHDSSVHQTFEEVQAFIKAILQTNNLNYLNLRMEDTFQIEVLFDQDSSNYLVNSIRVQYLFSTLTTTSFPTETATTLSKNTLKHEDYLAKQKAASLQRKLYGRGLHQWINHTVTLDERTDIELQQKRGSCFYEFLDVLPESSYVDSDQRRQQITNYETINVEKPAFATKQYFYKYRVPLNELKESGVRKYSYHQPIHFRYPSPSQLNYTKVYLHSIEEARIVCQGQSQGDKGRENVQYAIEQNLLFERGTAKIPNADISKSKVVSITTLVVCLVAALIIIKQLKKD